MLMKVVITAVTSEIAAAGTTAACYLNSKAASKAATKEIDKLDKNADDYEDSVEKIRNKHNTIAIAKDVVMGLGISAAASVAGAYAEDCLDMEGTSTEASTDTAETDTTSESEY